MKDRCGMCKLVGLIVTIGALNWGLVGIFQFDLVATIFGTMSMISRVIYALVGISGLLMLMSYFRKCPNCP